MRKPGELRTGQAVTVVLGGLALLALGAAGMSLIIGQLPVPARPSAWRWFGIVMAATALGVGTYQVLWWRGGALAEDTPQKYAEYRAQLRSAQSWIIPSAGIGAVLAVFMSPNFYVIIGAIGMGCMASIVLLGAFTQFTEPGRMLRSGGRTTPPR